MKTRGGKAKPPGSATPKPSSSFPHLDYSNGEYRMNSNEPETPCGVLREYDDGNDDNGGDVDVVPDSVEEKKGEPEKPGGSLDKQGDGNDDSVGYNDIIPGSIEEKKGEPETPAGGLGKQDAGNNNNGVYPNIVPDPVELETGGCEKIGVLGSSGADGSLVLFKGENCTICERTGGQMLVCCEIGCPIALHPECCDNKLAFDDSGNFYCPYCWYKRQVARCKQLREKAMMAKEVLLKFTDLGVGGVNGKKKNVAEVVGEETNLSGGGIRNYRNCDDRVDVNEPQYGPVSLGKDVEHQRDLLPPCQYQKRAEKILGEDSMNKEDSEEEYMSVSEEFGTFGNQEKAEAEGSNSSDVRDDSDIEDFQVFCREMENPKVFKALKDEERIQTENSRKADGILHAQMVENQQGESHNTCGKKEKRSANVSPHTSTEDTCDVVNSELEEDCKSEEEEHKHSTGSGSTNDGIQLDMDAKIPGKHGRRVRRRKRRKKVPLRNFNSSKKSLSREGTSSLGNNGSNYDKKVISQNSSPPQESGKRNISGEKRKRLHWTTEEEDILKEAVQQFDCTPKKNRPWRKILEFGRHVFHETRTPMDLKDKWKTVTRKSLHY